ncbi:hypothetical protein SDC9_201830 [bioreactor metagenome]|uniref:Uncharacterized protein n=1 Tax=bioreactor metagenome TaxID=1076179 RepID=A0A645IRZ9_9ZZZZ
MNGVCQGAQLFAIGRSVNNTGHDTLNIIDICQLIADFIHQYLIAKQFFHRSVTADNGGIIGQRIFNPCTQKALSHGTLGSIKHP